MNKEIVDNGKSKFVYRVYRSERYHSSWVGKGGRYPKIYTRKTAKEHEDHTNTCRGTGVAAIPVAHCSIHTIIS